MASWCLTKDATDKFLKGLRSGEIDPGKIGGLSSEERHAFLAKYVGEDNAKNVNSLFESKLLLQNQKAGMVRWAKVVAGLKPEVKRDLISRIERLDKVLSTAEQDAFLKDLASTKLGVDVTQEEASTIANLSKKVQEARAAMDKGGNRLDYGKAKVALGNYVSDLKNQAGKVTIGQAIKNPIQTVSKAAGITKSLKASLDNSAIFRQGWRTLLTHPGVWQRNARKSFVDIARTLGGKQVMDEVTADIVSRPNYDLYQKAKLATATIEEAFPTSLPEKVPVLGRAYKASEVAYTAFLHRMRADVFDKYIEVAQKSGVNIKDPKELKAIGSMVNSLTGRGNFGKYEGSAVNAVNNVFFSPRNLKSQVDAFLHPITGAGGSNFVRKESAKNLLKMVMGSAAILGVAKAIDPNSVDFDPRSSDFGKIKVGNTRFDVTGGMAPVVVLASRIITNSTKSSTTGVVTPLNTGKFGAPTSLDQVYNFFENKLSPTASVIKDLLKGEDFSGNKPTIASTLKNLTVPIGFTNYEELKSDPNAADTLLAMIADGLGIGTNTYGKSSSNWETKDTATINSFKEAVGADKFKQANDSFNTTYDAWFNKTKNTEEYKNLSSEEKQSLISSAKQKIQNNIFKEYDFKYKRAKSSKNKPLESLAP